MGGTTLVQATMLARITLANKRPAINQTSLAIVPFQFLGRRLRHSRGEGGELLIRTYTTCLGQWTHQVISKALPLHSIPWTKALFDEQWLRAGCPLNLRGSSKHTSSPPRRKSGQVGVTHCILRYAPAFDKDEHSRLPSSTTLSIGLLVKP